MGFADRLRQDAQKEKQRQQAEGDAEWVRERTAEAEKYRQKARTILASLENNLRRAVAQGNDRMFLYDYYEPKPKAFDEVDRKVNSLGLEIREELEGHYTEPPQRHNVYAVW